ncbi:alpha/beta hydrolase [Actinocrispum wychmicini]|uniref:Acetyl esterase n=1 Tax=Actinocrispum wychmicini TaxID=1213861 RepID=A0A4R2JHN2_9PSEU|nr:alpha/beta hydrolase [Actinocrispum wychmicini]TCO59371.1 acetyl esterase [Actinocrispum wychmicini]
MGVTWETVAVRGVPARVFRPADGRDEWLVWAHGGSWIRGSVDGWHEPCADLAERAGCTVVSVEYRLAPRHPHPAALTDVLTILDWASSKTGRVAVGGDSAGGTIAACAALTWRDLGRSLTAQVLAYPPFDPECRAGSYSLDTFPSTSDLRAAWRLYRAHGPGDCYSTPFDAHDLSGLAPAVLGVGEYDPVADDVREYAERLQAAGNTVELRVFPRLPHGVFLQPDGNPLRDWLGSAFQDLISTKETT